MKLAGLVLCLSVFFVSSLDENEEKRHNPSHHVHEKSHPEKSYHHRSQEKSHDDKSHLHKYQSRNHGHHLSKLAYRTNDEDQQQCRWVCTPKPGNSSNEVLQIFYRGNASLIGIVNIRSNKAVIIDYSSKLVAILNGEASIAIYYSIKIYEIYNTPAYKLTGKSDTGASVWTSSKSSFDAYFTNSGSLKEGYETAEKSGSKIDINTCQDVQIVLTGLGTDLTVQETLKLIVSFAIKLGGSLGFLYQGSGSFAIRNSFHWFLSVNIAFADLFDYAGKNLQSSHLGNLNLKSVFNATSGVEALLNLLSQIGRHVDLAKLFAGFLTNPEKILKLLVDLSASSHGGLDGFITIVVNIIQSIRGHGSISLTISSIINYNPDGYDTNITIVINEALELAASQNRTFNNGPQLEGLVKFLENINNNNWVFNNINISDIIKLLRSYNPSEAIPTIIKIISRFSPSRGIPQFFSFLVNLLNSTSNISAISRILPGLDLGNLTSGPGSILERALHGQNLTQLISTGCSISGLSNVPVIGQIISRISASFGSGFDIGRYLNATSVIGTIQSVLSGNGFWSTLQHNFGGILSGFEHGFSGIASGIEQNFETVWNTLTSIGSGVGNSSGSGGNSSGSGGNSSGIGGNIPGGPLLGGWLGNSGGGNSSSNSSDGGLLGLIAGGTGGGSSKNGSNVNGGESSGTVGGSASSGIEGQGESSSGYEGSSSGSGYSSVGEEGSIDATGEVDSTLRSRHSHPQVKKGNAESKHKSA